jgi:predicted nucleic acid-binding protein
MILLDTNVISEPLKLLPSRKVVDWLDAQTPDTLYLSATAYAESLTGFERMPEGRRKTDLVAAFSRLIVAVIGDRVIAFDQTSAAVHAKLMAEAGAKGVTVSFADCQIAAVAKLHDLTVATRDTGPFLAMGVRVIDPWEA